MLLVSAPKDYLITRLRQLQTLSRTKHEHAVFAGVLRWRAIRSSSRKASARPVSPRFTEPKSNVMRRSSNGAGRTGSNVLGARAPITASSRAARGVYSSVTRVASRPLSKRERSSLRASCRCASGSRRSTWSRNQRRASIELGRRLGVTQTAAWMMKHKLAQVMLERNASKRLKGNVQMDDAYIGGARSGRRGRGATGKTPFVAAIATTDDGKPDQIILRPVKAFSSFAIRKLASTALNPGANIVSDGLACFAAVTQAGCLHSSIKTGSGKQAACTPAFKWVNTALGNIKAALVGTYRAVRQKHVPRYLAEFEYRFNRRYDLQTMIPRLAFVALRTTPMPYRLLKLADVAA